MAGGVQSVVNNPENIEAFRGKSFDELLQAFVENLDVALILKAYAEPDFAKDEQMKKIERLVRGK